MMKAFKEFQVTEGSTENMWYHIEVRWRGRIIDSFLYPTMRETTNAFAAAGYLVRDDAVGAVTQHVAEELFGR